jgi:TolB protein
MQIFTARRILIGSCVVVLGLMGPLSAVAQSVAGKIGVFEGEGDVGVVLHAGSASYNEAKNSYTVAGSGENIWFGEDDFHFVWKRISGDVSLAADIDILGKTGVPHRKAVLMIRQSLDKDSAFADVVLHAVGKSSLQFRSTAGAEAHTIASNVYGPRRIKLEKRGDYFYAFLSGKDGELQPLGGSTKVHMTGPFYVGIGVCAHDKNALQTVVFSKLRMDVPRREEQPRTALFSTLETIAVGGIDTVSSDRQVEYVAPGRMEAPNWSRDGSYFIFNRDGNMFRAAVICGVEDVACAARVAPTHIAIGSAKRCSGDHGISPDGQVIAFTDEAKDKGGSWVYTLPISGGVPKRITETAPSYGYGWSPDGKTLAFTGERNGKFGVYTIPAGGGEEIRLATTEGVDAGPEYSPDGSYIYFSSGRTGSMQIWRMRADGTAQEQVSSDAYNDWSPHVSPNGQWMVFLSYGKEVKGHAADQDVMIQVMSLKTRQVRVLATLLGGKGTIDAPSWSPDSKKLAFVSYELLPLDGASETQ